MNLRYLLLVGSIGLSCTTYPVSFKGACDTLNGAIGVLQHTCTKFLYGYEDSPLDEKEEKAVRDLMQKMGITKDITLYKLSGTNMSSFCAGNRIFLNKRDYSNDDEFRFLVGHELMHSEKNHALKAVTVYLGSAYLIGKGIEKVLHDTGTDTKINTFNKKWLPFLPEKTLLSRAIWYPATLVGLGLTRPLMRMFEREADYEAQKRLGEHYGEDSIAKGASELLVRRCSLEPYSTYDTLFASHPHPIERMRNLKLSFEEVDRYCAQWIYDIKEVIVKAFKFPPEADDEYGPLGESYDMWRARPFCAVYPKRVLEKIQDASLHTFLDEVATYLKTPRSQRRPLKDVATYHMTHIDEAAKLHRDEDLSWVDTAHEIIAQRLDRSITYMCDYLTQYID